MKERMEKKTNKIMEQTEWEKELRKGRTRDRRKNEWIKERIRIIKTMEKEEIKQKN